MKERLLFMIIALALVLSGCTSTMTTSHEGPSTSAETGSGTITTTEGKDSSSAPAVRSGTPAEPLAPEMIVQYMDGQEQELLNSIFATHPMIRRERNNVFIIFSSDSLFHLDSSELTDDASKEMNLVAAVLKRYPQTHVRVNGFTDNIGSERHNLGLSQKRATAVRNALVQNGINPDRIRARGFGETKPIRSNATDSGRHHNRRVTVVIIPDSS